MEIDPGAAAIVCSAIEIDAPPELVWGVLSDIDRWPGWNDLVTSASLDGPLAAGTSFRWTSDPGEMTSMLHHVEPPHLLAWTATTTGVRAIHVDRLDASAGGTRVNAEESWDGLLVKVLRRKLGSAFEAALNVRLERLKGEAERRSGAGSAA